MKRMKFKIIIIAAGLASVAGMYACKQSFLTKTPLGALSPTTVANQTGVEAILIGAYAMLDGNGGTKYNTVQGNSYGIGSSNSIYGSIVADDSYKGSIASDQGDIASLETFTGNGSVNMMDQKWTVLFEGAQRANDVLRTLPLAKDISTADATEIAAEARFLRGLYHFEAKKMWNNIPFVDETITVANGNANVPNVDSTGNYINVWPKIEADFQFAMANLPATQSEKGRANKYAAEAFLAKVYMYEYKYSAAQPLLNDVITSGVNAQGVKYALSPLYESNFNADPSQKNGPESVFACQMSVNDGSQANPNGNFGDVLDFPNSAGPGGCCGFDNPSISLANAYKTDPTTGLPLLDGSFNSGKVVGDSSNIYTGTLDPRIDWVMGRPGIPYLDWGVTPKNQWIRDVTTNGYFSPKKNVYASSQKGTYSSTETGFWGATQIDATNYNYIRFADVLLWAAEVEVQIGDPNIALGYVNQVRARAANPNGWVYANSTYDAGSSQYKDKTTPADKYFIKPYPAGAFADKTYAMTAIRFERRLELAMEGQRFFDLTRYNFDPNYPSDMSATMNAYIQIETTRPSLFSVDAANFTKGKNEYYPIPQNQIDIENSGGKVLLKQNPHY